MSAPSPFDHLPVSLPQKPLPENVDPVKAAKATSTLLDNLSRSSFTKDAAWRDVYALTGTIRSFYTDLGVFQAWSQTSATVKPHSFKVDAEKARVVKLPNGSQWIDVDFTFETAGTPQTLCNGTVSIVYDDAEENWKIWVLATTLEEIKGLPNPDVYEIPKETVDADAQINGNFSADEQPSYIDCLIVGAGQAGLNTAGRCQALGIPYIIIDKHKEIGDSWRLRYKSARLHTIREYSHLAFDRTFGEEFEEYLHKDVLGDGYRRWAIKFGVTKRYWKETTFEGGKWDSEAKKWTVRLNREGKKVELTCAFVILAVGPSGEIPVMPKLPGKELFKGTVLHSKEYHYPDGFAGKNGIVVGSANTAHDIAEDMLEAGLASTTMVQRSKTAVVPTENFSRIARLGYNATIPTALTDRNSMCKPLAVERLRVKISMDHAAAQEPERWEALSKAGFKVEPYGDLITTIWDKWGGHYMDVGASAKIAKGLIKMKSDALPVRYTETGLVFSDGQELPADLIVFATGFDRDMKGRMRRFFGEEVADCVKSSGVNEEGEVIWGKFEHPGVAFVGNTLGSCRWYPRFVALHMKAILEGTPLPEYLDTPVPFTREPLKNGTNVVNGSNGA